MKAHRLLLMALLVAPPLGGALVTGCGGGGGGGGGGAPASPSLTGMVVDYSDQPANGVSLEVLGGGPLGTTRIDGLLLVGPVQPGPRVLRVGDSITTPTVLVPFSAVDGPNALPAPVFLPALTSGISGSVPASITTGLRVSGEALPGVTLDLQASTSVTFTQAGATDLKVLGVSPSRLPAALPSGRAVRAAWLVEPFGVRFSPAATLTIPRQDPLASGPFDAWGVSPTTGQWELIQSNVAPVSSDAFAIPVTQGTMVAIAPSSAPPRVAVSGRVVAGTQPVAGFRVTVWDRVSDPTGPDGLFTIADAPNHYGAFLVRAFPAQPGILFAPAVTQTTGLAAGLADVVVQARAPDAIRPQVRTTTPADNALNVDRNTQVVVVFSEPIDSSFTQPIRVVGQGGPVAGRLNFDNPFTVRFVPTQALDPLDTFTIVVDRAVQDLAGNAIDDSMLTFRFTTQGGAPTMPPTDTLSFGITPLRASRGDQLSVFGRNYTGGSQVLFGQTAGLVVQETTDEIQVRVPDFQPAGDVTLTVQAGGVNVNALRPLVLDLRASVARIYSGASNEVPLAFLDRQSPPAVIVVDGGNVGATAVAIDGVTIAAVDSAVMSGTQNVVTGRTVSLSAPAPVTLFSGPVVLKGGNGRPGSVYRFLVVRE